MSRAGVLRFVIIAVVAGSVIGTAGAALADDELDRYLADARRRRLLGNRGGRDEVGR